MSVDPYGGMDAAALARLIEESFGFKMRELEAKLQLGQNDIESRYDIAKLGSQTDRYTAGLSSETNKYIANLQSQTSRYSTDVGADTTRYTANLQAAVDRERLALAREELLKVGVPDMLIRKYVAEKNYEIARSTLSFNIATKAAELASSPDTFWMAKDFYDSLGSLQAGGKLPTFGAPSGTPQMKSLSELTAQLASDDPLAAAGQMVGAAGPAANIDWSAYTGQTGTIVPNMTAGATTATGGTTAGATPAGATTDPRLAATQAVVANSPPSVGNGYTDADIQALQTIGSIYKSGLSGLGPQALESMSPSQQQMFLAGGARLGYYNPDELQNYMRSRIYQDSASAA